MGMLNSDEPGLTGRQELIICWMVNRVDSEDGHEITADEAHEIFTGIYDDYKNKTGVPICMVVTFCTSKDAYLAHMYEGYSMKVH